ncbi:hypothetical protein ACPV4B_13660 [Vibrio parahaemolyticus]
MSLPKFLLRAFKPLTFTLIVILVVISIRQYQKSDGFWVFTIKQLNNQQKEIWFEVDVQHITQYLANLKTLREGYVFVIDATTGQ